MAAHAAHARHVRRHSIETACPSSIQATVCADCGLIVPVRYADYGYPIQPGQQPQQRYLTIPASHAGVAAIQRQGGRFTNVGNQPDNLNGYNMSGMDLAQTSMNSSPVHDLMQGCTLNSLLGASAFNKKRLANGGTIRRGEGDRHQRFPGRHRQ